MKSNNSRRRRDLSAPLSPIPAGSLPRAPRSGKINCNLTLRVYQPEGRQYVPVTGVIGFQVGSEAELNKILKVVRLVVMDPGLVEFQRKVIEELGGSLGAAEQLLGTFEVSGVTKRV
jgi:hypothetical protein